MRFDTTLLNALSGLIGGARPQVEDGLLTVPPVIQPTIFMSLPIQNATNVPASPVAFSHIREQGVRVANSTSTVVATRLQRGYWRLHLQLTSCNNFGQTDGSPPVSVLMQDFPGAGNARRIMAHSGAVIGGDVQFYSDVLTAEILLQGDVELAVNCVGSGAGVVTMAHLCAWCLRVS